MFYKKKKKLQITMNALTIYSLGMKHDGDGPSVLGSPGARSCSWTDHYIMGQTKFVPNQFKWSSCSVNQLRWLAT